MKVALPDSGSNAGTALAAVVAEMLGFTSRTPIRVLWGDTNLAPSSDEWFGGRTITLQGAAICSAADKLRKDLIDRASRTLKTDAATLQIKDGRIFPAGNPGQSTTFAALARAAGGVIRMQGRGVAGGERTGANKGVGACFVEVEVDTWTGDWHFLRATYVHDTGIVINPLVAEADMIGSLVESTQIATDPIPWDREFPGTKHYSVGYLVPAADDHGRAESKRRCSSTFSSRAGSTASKSFSETSIGAVPGALANAIYNACGVRIREHPITRDKIMAGLKRRA